MQKFTIRDPRSGAADARVELQLEFDIPLLRAVKAELGWDLLKPGDQPSGHTFPLLQILDQDLEVFVDLVHFLVKEQLTAKEITDLEFVKGLDRFHEVREAFFAELIGFFDRAGIYATAAALRKQIEVARLGAERIQQLDPQQFMGTLDQALQAGLKALTTVPLGQAKTTPGS